MSASAVPATPEYVTLRAGLVDLRAQRLQLVRGGQVALTSRETALLAALASRPSEVVTAEWLLEQVWGRRWTGEPSELGVVRNAVFKLRQKIERDVEAPEHLLTLHGEGYRFAPLVGPPPVPPPSQGEEAPIPAELPPAGDPWCAAWDVGRAAEERTARAVLAQPHAPLTLVGPWRAGKTWMLRRLLNELEPGDVAVRLDPRALPPEALQDLHALAEWIALAMAEALGHPEDEAERAISGPGPVAWRLKRWVESRALAQVKGRLLLIVEDLDRFATGASFPAFSAMLRSWAEEQRPGWSRLRLVFSSAVSPARLTSNLPSSPFNLGSVVPLGGLTVADVAELASRAALSAVDAPRLIHDLGGNPYLVRLELRAAATSAPGGLHAAIAPAIEEMQRRLIARPELRQGLQAAVARPDEPLPEPVLDGLLRLGLLISERRPYRAGLPALVRHLTA